MAKSNYDLAIEAYMLASILLHRSVRMGDDRRIEEAKKLFRETMKTVSLEAAKDVWNTALQSAKAARVKKKDVTCHNCGKPLPEGKPGDWCKDCEKDHEESRIGTDAIAEAEAKEAASVMEGSGNVPIGKRSKCGADWYSNMGRCGGCGFPGQ